LFLDSVTLEAELVARGLLTSDEKTPARGG
jgi:hypothetical protein